MRIVVVLAFVCLSCITSAAKPVRHYVFFGIDREKIKETKSFLETPAFEGAQVAYSSRQLEPGKDEYDFNLICISLRYGHNPRDIQLNAWPVATARGSDVTNKFQSDPSPARAVLCNGRP